MSIYQADIPSFGGPWGFTVAAMTLDAAAMTPAEVDKRIKARGIADLKKIVQVLVDRAAGIHAVLNAVEASHQHRGESEVGVRRRIGETDLDALALRVRCYRDAAGCRAVTAGSKRSNTGAS